MHTLLKGGMLEDVRGYLDIEPIPIQWTSAAAIMQKREWAEVRC